MSLIHLIARTATREELVELLRGTEEQRQRLHAGLERAERDLRHAIRTDKLGDSYACGIADDIARVLANTHRQTTPPESHE